MEEELVMQPSALELCQIFYLDTKLPRGSGPRESFGRSLCMLVIKGVDFGRRSSAPFGRYEGRPDATAGVESVGRRLCAMTRECHNASVQSLGHKIGVLKGEFKVQLQCQECGLRRSSYLLSCRAQTSPCHNSA
jgi:hypothetical protein